MGLLISSCIKGADNFMGYLQVMGMMRLMAVVPTEKEESMEATWGTALGVAMMLTRRMVLA